MPNLELFKFVSNAAALCVAFYIIAPLWLSAFLIAAVVYWAATTPYAFIENRATTLAFWCWSFSVVYFFVR